MPALDRRAFLFSASPFLLMAAAGAPSTGGEVVIERFGDDGASLGAGPTPKIAKSLEEWRKALPAQAFAVTREADTEHPYTGALLKEKRSGLYRCVCCGNALFDSATKFESGTGWPSFWQPIARSNVVENEDFSYGMQRIEVACRLCDAHLGHVFDDGPKPTGLRYCINSVALRFAPRLA